jgi:DNA-binding IscR family transcriptional regulator
MFRQSKDTMRLTLYTDYSLRVLLYLAAKEDEIVTISEMAIFTRFPGIIWSRWCTTLG